MQLKDKWRNLIKFQHLRVDEAAKVPYKAAVKAANAANATGGKAGRGADKGGARGASAANAKGGKAASAASARKTNAAVNAKKGKGASASSAKKGAGGKKTMAVSRDALPKKGGGGTTNVAGAPTMSAKEKLKARFGHRHDDDDQDEDDEYEEIAGVGRPSTGAKAKFDAGVDAVVTQLKAKRTGMVNEVEHAESELARMKTVVEEAEAVYSSARARVHEALVGAHGEDEYYEDGEGEDTADWDKYLHFGEHEDEDDDEEVARAAEAAAEAHEAVKRGIKKPSEKKPSEKRPKAAVDEDATDHDDDSDEEIDEDLVDSDEEDDDLDEEERAVRIANEVLAEAGLPPMHEIEHVLLTELKKLEAANAAVVHARLALEAVDAEFAEALVSAHNNAAANAKATTSAAFDHDDDLEKSFTMDGDEDEDDEDEDDEVDDEDDEEIDEDLVDDEEIEEEIRPQPTSKSKAKPKAKSAPSQNDGADAAGGRVVEDRRYGIYDARRYRSEAENDAAEAAASKGGKVSAASKRKAPTSSSAAAPKKSAKQTVKVEDTEIWYEQPNVAKAGAAVMPKKSQQFRAAPQSAPGSIPSWRRKRAATRVTIGRPVAGPTSWAAIGQHIIKE